MNLGWLVAGALALAISCTGIGYLSGRTEGRQQCDAKVANTKIDDQAAVITKQVEIRQEEVRRDDVVTDASNSAVASVADTAVAVGAADSVADRLRDELANAKRRFSSSIATCDARIAEQREAANAQYDLLAGLYQESDRAQGELAKEAESYRIAGSTCEKIYDGVRNSPK